VGALAVGIGEVGEPVAEVVRVGDATSALADFGEVAPLVVGEADGGLAAGLELPGAACVVVGFD